MISVCLLMGHSLKPRCCWNCGLYKVNEPSVSAHSLENPRSTADRWPNRNAKLCLARAGADLQSPPVSLLSGGISNNSAFQEGDAFYVFQSGTSAAVNKQLNHCRQCKIIWMMGTRNRTDFPPNTWTAAVTGSCWQLLSTLMLTHCLCSARCGGDRTQQTQICGHHFVFLHQPGSQLNLSHGQVRDHSKQNFTFISSCKTGWLRQLPLLSRAF